MECHCLDEVNLMAKRVGGHLHDDCYAIQDLILDWRETVLLALEE